MIDDNNENAATLENTGTEGVAEPNRKPKRAHLFQDSNWLPLGVSERLLRSKVGEVCIYPCSNPDDPSAESRNLISFSQRLRQTIPDFSITTTQCLLVYTEFESAPGLPGTKRAPRDRVERVIRCVTTSNSLHTQWVARELDIDEEARKLALSLEPRPMGRPRKPKPEPAADAPPKRGRGRPPKVRNKGQDSLI